MDFLQNKQRPVIKNYCKKKKKTRRQTMAYIFLWTFANPHTIINDNKKPKSILKIIIIMKMSMRKNRKTNQKRKKNIAQCHTFWWQTIFSISNAIPPLIAHFLTFNLNVLMDFCLMLRQVFKRAFFNASF